MHTFTLNRMLNMLEIFLLVFLVSPHTQNTGTKKHYMNQVNDEGHFLLEMVSWQLAAIKQVKLKNKTQKLTKYNLQKHIIATTKIKTKNENIKIINIKLIQQMNTYNSI